jgi:hypothetical protein
MFEQAVEASEAMRQAAQYGDRALIPALSGCMACQTAHMIAAPVLGLCKDCGAELRLIGSAQLSEFETLKTRVAAAAPAEEAR